MPRANQNESYDLFPAQHFHFQFAFLRSDTSRNRCLLLLLIDSLFRGLLFSLIVWSHVTAKSANFEFDLAKSSIWRQREIVFFVIDFGGGRPFSNSLKLTRMPSNKQETKKKRM